MPRDREAKSEDRGARKPHARAYGGQPGTHPDYLFRVRQECGAPGGGHQADVKIRAYSAVEVKKVGLTLPKIEVNPLLTTDGEYCTVYV
jgi:hypothetical protein